MLNGTVCIKCFLSRTRFTPCMSVEGGLSVMGDCQCSYTGFMFSIANLLLTLSNNVIVELTRTWTWKSRIVAIFLLFLTL